MVEQRPQAAEVHFEVACSDGREIDSYYNSATQKVMSDYADKGILLDFQRISIPGAHVYPGLQKEIADVVASKHKQYNGLPISFYIHIKSHGDVTPAAEHPSTFSLRHVEFNPNSLVNCGMIGGGELAAQVEKEILEAQPPLQITLRGEQRQVKDEDDMIDIDEEGYNDPQMLAGMIENFTDPARHARTMKGHMRKLIKNSAHLQSQKMQVLAGVHNYRTGEYVRVDARPNVRTAVDQVHEIAAQLRAKNKEDPEVQMRVQKQDPAVILFHHAEVEYPRATALEAMKEILQEKNPLTGNVFSSSVVSLDANEPLAVAKPLGVYFAATHYDKARNLVILGRTKEEAEKMWARIENDPYFQLVTQVLSRNHGIDFKGRTYLTWERAKPINVGVGDGLLAQTA